MTSHDWVAVVSAVAQSATALLALYLAVRTLMIGRDAPFLDREIDSLRQVHQLIRAAQDAHNAVLTRHPGYREKAEAFGHWVHSKETLARAVRDHGEVFDSHAGDMLDLDLTESKYLLSAETEVADDDARAAIVAYGLEAEKVRRQVTTSLRQLRDRGRRGGIWDRLAAFVSRRKR